MGRFVLLTPAQVRLARRLWYADEPSPAIAAAVGCSASAVRKRAFDEGWPKRTGPARLAYDRILAAAPCAACGHGLFPVREYDAAGRPTGRITLRHPWEGGACKAADLYADLSAAEPVASPRRVVARCAECRGAMPADEARSGKRSVTCSRPCRLARERRQRDERVAREPAHKRRTRALWQARADARDARDAQRRAA